MFGNSWNVRDRLAAVDKAYMRELLNTEHYARAKAAIANGDLTKFQDIVFPVVYPQVRAAVAYQASVFLSGTPLFPVNSSPESEDAAKQLETKIDNDAISYGWVRQFLRMFSDGFKYELAAVEVTWDKKTVPVYETLATSKQAKVSQVAKTGNKLKALDLYNSFWDSRPGILPCDIPEQGEFVGYTELYSWVKLKELIDSLPATINLNVLKLSRSGSVADPLNAPYYSYHIPQINPEALISTTPVNSSTGFNWAKFAGIQPNGPTRHSQIDTMYQVTHLYIRMIPDTFELTNVANSKSVQIWKFLIVNFNLVIYAERLTDAHGLIPVLFLQPNEDGLAYQTKSHAQNVMPIQNLTSAIANASIAARRRAIGDRALYDPLRIAPEDINAANPVSKIPVRMTAYGKSISDAYYQIPFRDDQQVILSSELQQMGGLADLINGTNPAKRGGFVKGNKTMKEFDTIMSNSDNRDRMTALLAEAQIFTPMKYIIKSNILQNQSAETLYSRSLETTVKIDPIILRNTVMEFQVSDGLTPAEKTIHGDALASALQYISTSPALASQYNIAPAFSYLMKTQGAKLTPFEKSKEQVAYEQAFQAWQSLGLEFAKKGVEFKQPQPTPQQYGYLINQQPGAAG